MQCTYDKFMQYLVASSFPTLVVPSPPPSLRGRQLGTVLPRSTSTSTLLLSIFFPSACLYAAELYPKELEMEVRLRKDRRTGV